MIALSLNDHVNAQLSNVIRVFHNDFQVSVFHWHSKMRWSLARSELFFSVKIIGKSWSLDSIEYTILNCQAILVGWVGLKWSRWSNDEWIWTHFLIYWCIFRPPWCIRIWNLYFRMENMARITHRPYKVRTESMHWILKTNTSSRFVNIFIKGIIFFIRFVIDWFPPSQLGLLQELNLDFLIKGRRFKNSLCTNLLDYL